MIFDNTNLLFLQKKRGMIIFNKRFVILIVIGLIFTSCKHKSKSSSPFSGDVKIIFEDRIEIDSKLFGLKYWVTDEEKFNGKLTLKLDSTHKYGFSEKLENLIPDAFVRATVWKKGKTGGNLALTSDDLNFRRYSRKVLKHGEDGWNKILLEAFIPPNYQGEKVKLFVMNDSKNDAYFADLDVTVYNRKPYPEFNDESTLEIFMDENDIDYINKKRKKSFEREVITRKTKKEFDAFAIIEGEKLPISIRIKGDWLDHIQGNKWSFRIKMKEGNFRGMKEFSIQNPGARGFLNEWVIHKIFEEEDVLTTRYGFIPVTINGTSVRIYAYEEHFEKRLIESKKRREGPILKFNEDVMWSVVQANIKNKKNIAVPVVESAMITPFKKKKTMKNEVLRQQFIIGQNLLNQYRYDDQLISDLFKTDLLAKFYAITNLGRVWHPVRWYNERFYYDPIASKLEIIAFDCNTGDSSDKVDAWMEPNIIYETKSYDYDDYLSVSPFNDSVFLKLYLKNMSEYLFTDRLVNIIEKHHDELKKYEKWIQMEYPTYRYDYKFFEKSIAQLKPKFKKLENKLKDTPLKATLKVRDYNYGENGVIEGLSLQGFAASYAKISVKNFHSKSLFLVGYSSKDKAEYGINYFKKPIKFEAYKNLEEIDTKEISCFFSPDKIYFKENLDDTLVYNSKVMPWPNPGHSSPRQDLLKRAITKSNDFAIVSGNTLKFKPGKHVFNRPVVVPAGMNVIITKGTRLDFIEGAFFLSFSTVNIKGSANNKVIIESSDGSGMGFTIIGSSERSNIENTTFKGWNTLNYKGWILTGAVTFYESDVTIEHTEFLNNNCEDALNIVRADFSLKHSLITDAFADGFDADFATGIVYDCDFNQIGNDGIDYSGSEIKIENVRIDGAGDKGISGGEGSTLNINNSVISNSNIGIASKDDSHLNIENISLINCNCGFAAYQKKIEYDPADMTIVGCEMKNVEDVYMLGLESVINLEGDVNKGTIKINVDSLYMR